MSVLRKLERQIVRKEMHDKGIQSSKFNEYWHRHREEKYITKDADGHIIENRMPKNTQKKKQVHFDNVEQYNRLFAFIDEKNEEAKSEVKAE